MTANILFVGSMMNMAAYAKKSSGGRSTSSGSSSASPSSSHSPPPPPSSGSSNGSSGNSSPKGNDSGGSGASSSGGRGSSTSYSYKGGDTASKYTNAGKTATTTTPSISPTTGTPPVVECSHPPCSPAPNPPPPVDCKTNPSEPSCTSKPLTIPSIDCTKKPEDPSCKTSSSPKPCPDGSKPVDGKCPTEPQPKTTCPSDSKLVNGKCLCSDGSVPVNDKCLRLFTPPPTKCPNGSVPDANGKCSKTFSSRGDFDAGIKEGSRDAFNDGYHGNDFFLTKCQQNDSSDFCRGYREGYTQSAYENGVNHSTPQSNCEHFDTCIPPQCPTGFKLVNGKCEQTIIRNIIIRESQQQQKQSKPNTLIQLDSEQVCRELGDKACISSLHNFKLLFIHAFKDSEGNWVVSGEVQNISPKTINQLETIVHFYDSDGNIVGLKQAFTTPSKLISLQTATFNIKVSPSEQTGTPKYFRISFEFVT